MRWDPPTDPKDLLVERVNGALELRGATDAPGSGVVVDLSAVRRQGMRNTPLGRAIGDCKSAVDATAGLCGDAYLLALLGCQVTAIERSPILAQLVEDGLARARAGASDDSRGDARIGSRVDSRIDQPALARLQFICGDSCELLPTLPRPDIVLLDPMFPARRKASALPRKDIRLVGAAAAAAAAAPAANVPATAAGSSADGGAPEEARLFDIARACALRRVLVKRADDSPPLECGAKPDLSFSGRTSRVDVYLVK